MTVPAGNDRGVDELVRQLWERARPTVAKRLELLEAAARAVAAAEMNSQIRHDAILAAHKLAGSLGTYGMAEGSELARAIELELEGDCDPARLEGLVADLRSATGLAS